MASTLLEGSGTAARAVRAVSSLRVPAGVTAPTSAQALVIAWVATRALTLMLLLLFGEGVVNLDVNYYARSLADLSGPGSLRETLQEYPLPVLGLLLPPYWAALGTGVGFAILFVLSMLAIDAAFVTALWRAEGRTRGPAVTAWLCLMPAIGPLAYFRFDLVPAVLAGGALLVAVRRPVVSGALTAVGAAVKLWPVLLLPTLMVRRTDRRLAFAGFAIAGAVIGSLCLLAAGTGRVLSPLRWQSERGLQIESVAATPLMLLRSVNKSPWDVSVSQYKAFEIFGPGVELFTLLTTVLTLAGLAVLAVLWWRAVRLPAVSVETLGWLFLATTSIMIVTNKTLSPQYILWLLGPMCALLVLAPRNEVVRRSGRLLLGIAVLTQLVFPILYSKIDGRSLWAFPATSVLALRNGLLVLLAWTACREIWRKTRQGKELCDPAVALAGP